MNDVKFISYGVSIILQSRHCFCDVIERQTTSRLYSEPAQSTPCPLPSHFWKIRFNITSQNNPLPIKIRQV